MSSRSSGIQPASLGSNRSVRIEKGAVQVTLSGTSLTAEQVTAAVEDAISRILAENDERRH